MRSSPQMPPRPLKTGWTGKRLERWLTILSSLQWAHGLAGATTTAAAAMLQGIQWKDERTYAGAFTISKRLLPPRMTCHLPRLWQADYFMSNAEVAPIPLMWLITGYQHPDAIQTCSANHLRLETPFGLNWVDCFINWRSRTRWSQLKPPYQTTVDVLSLLLEMNEIFMRSSQYKNHLCSVRTHEGRATYIGRGSCSTRDLVFLRHRQTMELCGELKKPRFPHLMAAWQHFAIAQRQKRLLTRSWRLVKQIRQPFDTIHASCIRWSNHWHPRCPSKPFVFEWAKAMHCKTAGQTCIQRREHFSQVFVADNPEAPPPLQPFNWMLFTFAHLHPHKLALRPTCLRPSISRRLPQSWLPSSWTGCIVQYV